MQPTYRSTRPNRRCRALGVEPGRVADPGREEARPQLRLERLAERVVLRQGERGNELTEAERRVGDRETSRCFGADGRPLLHGSDIAGTELPLGGHDGTTEHRRRPDQVGLVADQTGPLAPVGIANANVARMVVGDINAKGGLLGRGSSCSRGRRHRGRRRRRRGRKLVKQRPVDLVLGGIHSSTRQAIKGSAVTGQDALHLPRAVRGAGVRSADLLHRPGAGPAGRPAGAVADGARPGRRRFTCLGRLHLAARDERARPRDRDGQRRLDRGRGVLPARSHRLPGDRRADRRQRRRRGVQHDGAARVVPFFEQLHASGFSTRGGQLVCTYFDENF